MKNMLIRCAFAAFAALFGQILLADATVPTMTPTPTETDPLAGKTAAWTKRVTVGANENVDVAVYKDFAYGTRDDASDEGAGYSLHNWIMDDVHGSVPYHRHRSGQYFDVFKPSNMTSTAPVLIYLHGGSWSQCYDKDGSALDMLASIAAKGYVVITADYILQNDITEGGATTLREGANFAAMLRDVDTLVSYLRDFLPAMGVTPTKLAIGGASAGGHLSSLYAYDQGKPSHLGLNLAHAIPVAVELDLVGPASLGNYLSDASFAAIRQQYGDQADLVIAAFTMLFEGLTGTTTVEAAGVQMALYSPVAMVTADTPKTIAAYAELTDATGAGLGTDGAVMVSDYHALTNALTTAGVEYLARLNLGVNHGEIDNPRTAPQSVEWIVASMDQAKTRGWYAVDAEVDDREYPAGYNVWKAAEAGKASVASNWSLGRVPTATDNILFDGAFSTADCEWDGGVNGLTTSVAAWEQRDTYTGTVTIDTAFTGGFQALTITGAGSVLGGSWTHPAGATGVSEPVSRLKVIVGDTFTLGAKAKINLKGKGFAGSQKPDGSVAGSHAASASGYGKVYGNVYAPELPGSGANGATNRGGGALWLEVAGTATINGEISVRPEEQEGENPAAGSVYVKAAACAGSGYIRADYSATGYYHGKSGSGGRVAIVLTEATALGLPEANVGIHGINAGSTGGGGGTFFLKLADQTNGTLILDDTRTKSYGARWHMPTAITAIPAGETWTFDAIKIKNYGMLAIPTGTTLVLPNGISSITATASRQGGLLYQGGTIQWGQAPYVFENSWVFQANVPYVFDGDVVVKSGGNLGCLDFQGSVNFSDMTKCDITVNGNLTIEQGGCVYATGRGPNMPVNRNAYAYHGGSTVKSEAVNLVYDSVFNPSYPGYTAASGDQAESSSGGGLVKLDVKGTLTVDGAIVADGTCSSGDAGGSGGTINITAATLADSTTGTIHANAQDHSSHYSGGGGRVAIRLTNGAFSDYWLSHVQAKGKTIVKSTGEYWPDKSSSAGTVYLQPKGVKENAGTIYVRNDGNALNTSAVTVLPSVKTTKTPADEISDYRFANLIVGGSSNLRVAESFRCERVTMERGCTIDLCGKTLAVSHLQYDGAALTPRTYSADARDFLTDSVGGGALVVTGGGLSIVLR